jgi:hypothetical protein
MEEDECKRSWETEDLLTLNGGNMNNVVNKW